MGSSTDNARAAADFSPDTQLPSDWVATKDPFQGANKEGFGFFLTLTAKAPSPRPAAPPPVVAPPGFPPPLPPSPAPLPVPLGVFRAVESPAYESLSLQLAADARKRRGPGTLKALFEGGYTWTIA